MEYNYKEAMKIENQLCFPLYAAARTVTGLYTPYLKELKLTYTQYIVMLVLWEKDGVTVGDICKKLMLDNGTVMNGKLIESPKSFQVACTVTTQIIASVASSQYGGQSVDMIQLGKYLRKSYEK